MLPKSTKLWQLTCAALLFSAGCWFFWHRGEAKIAGQVETATISFVADRPYHNKGIFASDTLVDVTVHTFGKVESLSPETPISITPGLQPILRFKNVSLDSLDMANPLHYDLRGMEGGLTMNLRREPSIQIPICSIRLQSKSRLDCMRCDGREIAIQMQKIGRRLKTAPGLSSEALLLHVFPLNGEAKIEIRAADNRQQDFLSDEHSIPLQDGSSIQFWDDHESTLQSGSLDLSTKDAQSISEGDALELVGISSAVLDKISFSPNLSTLSVSWTVTARQTLYRHGRYPETNINPRKISSITGNPSFESVTVLLGTLGAAFELGRKTLELLNRRKSKEA